MGYKYSNLDELRQKKELLKKQLSEKEALFVFDDPKESLSALTKGFTDPFLKQNTSDDGSTSLSLDTQYITKKIATGVKDHVISKNAMMGIADSAMRGGAIDELVKLSTVSLVTSFAQKNIKSSQWKKKLIGLALIYLAPIALRFIRNKIDEYQKNKSVSSLEKLI